MVSLEANLVFVAQTIVCSYVYEYYMDIDMQYKEKI